MHSRTKGEKIFNVINIIILTFVLIVTLYPFYYTFIASISDGSEVIKGTVILFPKKVNLKAYKAVITIRNFLSSYGNTFYYTFFGSITSMSVMTMGSYALSRKHFLGRRVISLFIVFTMWFSAGIIPFYLNMDSLNLINTRTGIIFGFAVSAFYIIIMRSFFESLPEELEEAGKLDGVSNFGIFWRIFLPISTPMLATIGLYCVVDRWNGYFWAMILLKDEKLVPLQVVLKKLIIESQILASLESGMSFDYTTETIIYAVVIVAIIPILAIYPFVQGFFVKGLTVGAIKG